MAARGTVMLAAIALMLVAALEAVAQQPTNVIERQIQGQTQNENPYFQPAPAPYQGSYARRMQQQMQELWGNTTAGRGVPPPQWGPIYLPPSQDLIFVHPPERTVRCAGSRGCYRFYNRGYPGGYGWRRW